MEEALIHHRVAGGGTTIVTARVPTQHQTIPKATVIMKKISGININAKQQERNTEKDGVNAIEVHGSRLDGCNKEKIE